MAATQLRITQHPGGAESGLAFFYPLTVEFRDAANHLVATETSSVVVTVASGTGAILGTATIAAVGGVVTSTTLGITGTGVHTLTVTSGVLPSVTTRPFNVLPANLPTSGTPDVSLLPASNFYLRNVAALNSQSITGATAAGTRFREPVSGVWCEKISDQTHPVTTTAGADSSYSSMGNPISLPWTRGDGKTVRTLYVTSLGTGASYLVDHEYGVGVDLASYRSILTAGGKSVGGPIDTKFSFSYNPATPTIGYFADGGEPGKLYRYDVQTNAEAPTGNFTSGGKTFTGMPGLIGEIMHTFDDRYFLIAESAQPATGDPEGYSYMVRWDSLTNTEVSFPNTRLQSHTEFSDGSGGTVNVKQGYLDRITGRYVAMELSGRTSPSNKAMFLWDCVNDTFTLPLTTTNHSDWVGGYFLSQDENGQFFRYDPAPVVGTSPVADPGTFVIPLLDPAVVGNCFSQHRSGKWNQGAASLESYQLLSLDQEGHTGKGPALGTTYAPWVLDAGSVYKQTPSFTVGRSGVVATVAQFGERTGRYAYQLDAAASRATMTEGTFYYDAGTTTLYVWPVGSKNLTCPTIGTATAVAGGSMTPGLYQYWVAAITASGESILSAPTADYGGGVLVTGANLSATVTWSAFTGATGYRVYRRMYGVPDQIQDYFDVGNVTSFTDTGTAPSTGYPNYAPMGVSPYKFDAAATFLRSDGLDARYLATFGSNSFQYWGIPVVSISPDGALAIGKSSMGYPDGAPQVFVAEVPLQATGGGTADHLALSVEPAGAVSGVALTTQPVVLVEDSSNATVTSDTSTVTVAWTTLTGDATLSGTTTAVAVAGIATFATLALTWTVDSTGYFTFTDGSLTSVNSATLTLPVAETPPDEPPDFGIPTGAPAVYRMARGRAVFAGFRRMVRAVWAWLTLSSSLA